MRHNTQKRVFIKRLHLFLVGALLAMVVLALDTIPVAQAATFTIPDGDAPGLIDAIDAANDEVANPGPDTINLASGDIYILEVVNNIADGNNGLPSIASEIIINGLFATVQRSNATVTPDFRVFHVASSGNLTLNQLTVKGGSTSMVAFPSGSGSGILNFGTLTLNGSTIRDNTMGHSGGGISNLGSATLISSAVTDNIGGEGAGIRNFVGATMELISSAVTGNNGIDQGGILNQGTLTLTNSTVNDNTGGHQGGISNLGDPARMTLVDSAISGNSGGFVGGIFNSGLAPDNAAVLINSTVSNNHGGNLAGSLGGIHNCCNGTMKLTNSLVIGNIPVGIANSGALELVDSAISGNSGPVGGITNSLALKLVNTTVSGNIATARGGGIESVGGGVVSMNSTISGNTAPEGGGIYIGSGGLLKLMNSTISGNTATTAGGGIASLGSTWVILTNTIIAGNSGPSNPDCFSDSVTPPFIHSHNLIGDGTGCGGFTHGVNGDQVGSSASPINPLLGLLQNNGGPTQTHALLLGSSAIDAGDPAGCTDPSTNLLLTTDQRGFDRPVDGDGDGIPVCDIGAYEAEPVQPGLVPAPGFDLSVVASKTGTTAPSGGLLLDSLEYNSATDTWLAINAQSNDDIVEITRGGVFKNIASDFDFGGLEDDKLAVAVGNLAWATEGHKRSVFKLEPATSGATKSLLAELFGDPNGGACPEFAVAEADSDGNLIVGFGPNFPVPTCPAPQANAPRDWFRVTPQGVATSLFSTTNSLITWLRRDPVTETFYGIDVLNVVKLVTLDIAAGAITAVKEYPSEGDGFVDPEVDRTGDLVSSDVIWVVRNQIEIVSLNPMTGEIGSPIATASPSNVIHGLALARSTANPAVNGLYALVRETIGANTIAQLVEITASLPPAVTEALAAAGIGLSDIPPEVLDALIAADQMGLLDVVASGATANRNFELQPGAALVLGSGAQIDGNIKGDPSSTVVVGTGVTLDGNVRDIGSLVYSSGAVQNGNLKVGRVVVLPGATVTVKGNVEVNELIISAEAQVMIEGNLSFSSKLQMDPLSSLVVGGKITCAPEATVSIDATADINGNIKCEAILPLMVEGVELAAGDRTGIGEKDGVFYTNKDTFVIGGRASGRVVGAPDLLVATVEMEGQNTGTLLSARVIFTGAELEAQFSDMPDDRYTVAARVLLPNGNEVVSETITVVADRAVPEILIDTPLRKTSGPFPFLYLGTADKEKVDATHNPDEQRTRRNVFARDTFSILGKVTDKLSGIVDGLSQPRVPEVQPSQVQQISTSGTEMTFPFEDILEEIDIRAVEAGQVGNLVAVPPLALSGSPGARERSFAVTSAAAGLSDSDDFDANTTSLHAFVLRAEDSAGNVGVTSFLVKVDTQPPQFRGPHIVVGPIQQIDTGPDAVSVILNNVPHLPEDPFELFGGRGSWQVPPALTPTLLVGDHLDLDLTIQDYAGNEQTQPRQADFQLFVLCTGGGREPMPFAVFIGCPFGPPDPGVFTARSHFQDWQVIFVDEIGTIVHLSLPQESFTLSEQEQLGQPGGGGDPVVDEDTVFGPDEDEDDSLVVHGAVGGRLDQVTMSGTGPAGYLPRVDQVAGLASGQTFDRPASPFTARGFFPHATNDPAYQTFSFTLASGSFEGNYTGGPVASSSAAGEGTFRFTEADLDSPGWQAGSVSYSGRVDVAPDEFSSVVGAAFFNPRVLNMLHLTPDTVATGERVTMRIRGGFPKDLNTIAVTFTPSGHSNPAPQVVQATFIDNKGQDQTLPEFRVLEEDPFISHVFRTIEFEADVPEGALGLYDIKVTAKKSAQADGQNGEVDGLVIKEGLNVVKIEVLKPNFDSDGFVVDTDIQPFERIVENVHPVKGFALDLAASETHQENRMRLKNEVLNQRLKIRIAGSTLPESLVVSTDVDSATVSAVVEGNSIISDEIVLYHGEISSETRAFIRKELDAVPMDADVAQTKLSANMQIAFSGTTFKVPLFRVRPTNLGVFEWIDGVPTINSKTAFNLFSIGDLATLNKAQVQFEILEHNVAPGSKEHRLRVDGRIVDDTVQFMESDNGLISEPVLFIEESDLFDPEVDPYIAEIITLNNALSINKYHLYFVREGEEKYRDAILEDASGEKAVGKIQKYFFGHRAIEPCDETNAMLQADDGQWWESSLPRGFLKNKLYYEIPDTKLKLIVKEEEVQKFLNGRGIKPKVKGAKEEDNKRWGSWDGHVQAIDVLTLKNLSDGDPKQIAGIVAHGGSGPELNKVASVTISASSNKEAAKNNLFDEKPETFWQPAATDTTPFVQFDFGQGKEDAIDEVGILVVKETGDSAHGKDIILERSTDGNKWITDTKMTLQKDSHGLKFHSENIERFKFWRVRFHGSWAKDGTIQVKKLTINKRGFNLTADAKKGIDELIDFDKDYKNIAEKARYKAMVFGSCNGRALHFFLQMRSKQGPRWQTPIVARKSGLTTVNSLPVLGGFKGRLNNDKDNDAADRIFVARQFKSLITGIGVVMDRKPTKTEFKGDVKDTLKLISIGTPFTYELEGVDLTETQENSLEFKAVIDTSKLGKGEREKIPELVRTITIKVLDEVKASPNDAETTPVVELTAPMFGIYEPFKVHFDNFRSENWISANIVTSADGTSHLANTTVSPACQSRTAFYQVWHDLLVKHLKDELTHAYWDFSYEGFQPDHSGLKQYKETTNLEWFRQVDFPIP